MVKESNRGWFVAVGRYCKYRHRQAHIIELEVSECLGGEAQWRPGIGRGGVGVEVSVGGSSLLEVMCVGSGVDRLNCHLSVNNRLTMIASKIRSTQQLPESS